VHYRPGLRTARKLERLRHFLARHVFGELLARHTSAFWRHVAACIAHELFKQVWLSNFGTLTTFR
jgi:hypothetical protein